MTRDRQTRNHRKAISSRNEAVSLLGRFCPECLSRDSFLFPLSHQLTDCLGRKTHFLPTLNPFAATRRFARTRTPRDCRVRLSTVTSFQPSSGPSFSPRSCLPSYSSSGHVIALLKCWAAWSFPCLCYKSSFHVFALNSRAMLSRWLPLPEKETARRQSERGLSELFDSTQPSWRLLNRNNSCGHKPSCLPRRPSFFNNDVSHSKLGNISSIPHRPCFLCYPPPSSRSNTARSFAV